MDINCKVSINRRSDDLIIIEVTDETSRARFLQLEMTPEQFALAVTGLGFREARGTVMALDVVGKRRIDEDRQVVYPGKSYEGRDVMRAWLEANCQEPGWHLDSYLGSQRSVGHNAAGETVLNYRVSRFED